MERLAWIEMWLGLYSLSLAAAKVRDNPKTGVSGQSEALLPVP
jgi:hypothetical protein